MGSAELLRMTPNRGCRWTTRPQPQRIWVAGRPWSIRPATRLRPAAVRQFAAGLAWRSSSETRFPAAAEGTQALSGYHRRAGCGSPYAHQREFFLRHEAPKLFGPFIQSKMPIFPCFYIFSQKPTFIRTCRGNNRTYYKILYSTNTALSGANCLTSF